MVPTSTIVHHARVLLKAGDGLKLREHKEGKDYSNKDKTYSTTTASSAACIVTIDLPSDALQHV
jgi:hypothetical protein